MKETVQEQLEEWKALAFELRSNETVDRLYVASQLELAVDEVRRLLHLVDSLATTASNRQTILNKLRADLSNIHRDTMELQYDVSNLMIDYAPEHATSHLDVPTEE